MEYAENMVALSASMVRSMGVLALGHRVVWFEQADELVGVG